MLATLEANCAEHGITLHGLGSGRQGIVHVIAPELGLTQPGMTVACGDSHTSTHGAFGAIAFGIGTSQVRDVLASDCALRRTTVPARGRGALELEIGATTRGTSVAVLAASGFPSAATRRAWTRWCGRPPCAPATRSAAW